MLKRLLPMMTALGVSCFALQAQAAPVEVYNNDFESDVVGTSINDGLWSANTKINGGTPDTSNFLGGAANTLLGLSNEEAILSLSGLAPHDSVKVAFNLYLFNTWDGNGLFGPDTFRFAVNGIEMFSETFSNFIGISQTYCPNVPSPCNEGTGSLFGISTTTPGYRLFSIYHLEIDFASMGPDLDLMFSAFGLQQLADESWGVDNVRVTINTENGGGTGGDVPEPTTLALIGLGLSGIGAARRRRKAI